jgi:hypothetical protein
MLRIKLEVGKVIRMKRRKVTTVKRAVISIRLVLVNRRNVAILTNGIKNM